VNEAARNVETLRRGFEAFSRGDFDESLREIHPEVDRVVFYSHRLRDGKLICLRPFDDEASARRDLGLTGVA
jgi:hypothetical protein